eukprot:UN2793
MATTSKEGSRRANYPILTQGGSDTACYLFSKLFTLGVLEWTCLRHKVQR